MRIPYKFKLAVSAVSLIVGIAAHAETSVTGGITGVYQRIDEGGIDNEWTLSADFVVTTDIGFGTWTLYIEGSTQPDADGIFGRYPTANADAGSVLNRDGDGGIQISELHYSFPGSDRERFTIGLIDPSAWLDQSAIASDENAQFLNGSLTQNATIAFPDYTIGAIYRRSAIENTPEVTVVVAGSDGIADIPDRSYQDLLSLTSDERGVFVGSNVVWSFDEWSYGVGAWWRSDDHVVLGTVGQPAEKNYGGYMNLDWSNGPHSFMARLGSAKERVSVANRFASVAYRRDFGNVAVGVGISRTAVANTFRQRDLDDVTGAELYLRWSLG